MGISSQSSKLLTVEAITAARTMGAADSGKRFTVASMVANYAITLPPPITGLSFELLGVGANYYATLAFTGNLFVSNGALINGGVWSNINLAEKANSVRIWSDGTAWYLQTLAGRLLIDPAILSDNYQAVTGMQVVKNDQNFNNVGSFCFANGPTASTGATVAGSSLYPSNGSGTTLASSLPGTWRALGYLDGAGGAGNTTLFQRIA